MEGLIINPLAASLIIANFKEFTDVMDQVIIEEGPYCYNCHSPLTHMGASHDTGSGMGYNCIANERPKRLHVFYKSYYKEVIIKDKDGEEVLKIPNMSKDKAIRYKNSYDIISRFASQFERRIITCNVDLNKLNVEEEREFLRLIEKSFFNKIH